MGKGVGGGGGINPVNSADVPSILFSGDFRASFQVRDRPPTPPKPAREQLRQNICSPHSLINPHGIIALFAPRRNQASGRRSTSRAVYLMLSDPPCCHRSAYLGLRRVRRQYQETLKYVPPTPPSASCTSSASVAARFSLGPPADRHDEWIALVPSRDTLSLPACSTSTAVR